jgi:hypothetical protein
MPPKKPTGARTHPLICAGRCCRCSSAAPAAAPILSDPRKVRSVPCCVNPVVAPVAAPAPSASTYPAALLPSLEKASVERAGIGDARRAALQRSGRIRQGGKAPMSGCLDAGGRASGGALSSAVRGVLMFAPGPKAQPPAPGVSSGPAAARRPCSSRRCPRTAAATTQRVQEGGAPARDGLLFKVMGARQGS